jgi:prepilin-type N-terminal cleavage/methylation domain-containing protein
VNLMPNVRPCTRDQRGFTLVEVMVAIFILLVGVLGIVAMVDGANAVTSKTKAREGGTNIARSVIEISRSIRYRDLTATALLAQLDSRPGLEDVSPLVGYTIESRGIDYESTITVCSLDDPQDGIGTHSGPITFCSDSATLAAGATSNDRNPDDYKRVRVTLNWNTRATGQSVTQTSSIINPVGGLGPSVLGLIMESPASTTTNPLTVEADVSPVKFKASTSSSSAEVNWSVSGKLQGKASGGPKTWTFNWDIGTSAAPKFYDCTYVIQADAFDTGGRSGAPLSKTVRLNRMLPIKPAGFVGGRNGNANYVDLSWVPNPECDVVGYRIFRGTSAATITTPVTCVGEGSSTLAPTKDSCIDDPGGGDVYYQVVAVDTSTDGTTIRQGVKSDILHIGPPGANALPSAPANLSACIGGQPGCNVANGVPADDGVLVIRWDPSTDSDGTIQLYRIYRDGVAYTNRNSSFYPKTGELLAWIEPKPDTNVHAYRISAVDDKFGESALSAPLSASP